MTREGDDAQSLGLSRSLALLVAGTFFMENLDGTILATALPRIAATFRVGAVSLSVLMTAYLLTLAVLIPASAWAADRLGARNVYVAAIAVFTVASVGCAASTSVSLLVAMRVLQGVGGAMMVPVGRLVVLRTTARADTIRAIAYLTWPALIAPLIAPVLGGLVVTHASWRWIFLVNLPLGAVALALALRIVPGTGRLGHLRLDWLGLIGCAATISMFVLVAQRSSSLHSAPSTLIAGFGVASVLLVLSAAHLRRVPNPLIDLRVLRIPTFRASALGGSAFRLVVGAMPLLVPLTLQIAYGWTPVKSGLLLVAIFLGNVGIKPLTTPMLRTLGFRTVLLLSCVGSVCAFVLFVACGPRTPDLVIAGVLFLSGIFRSTGFSAYNTLAFADIDAVMTSHASTFFATLQQLAAGLGIALAALAVHLGRPASRLLFLHATRLNQYRMAVVLLAIVLLVPIVESLLLAPGAGEKLTLRQG